MADRHRCCFPYRRPLESRAANTETPQLEDEEQTQSQSPAALTQLYVTYRLWNSVKRSGTHFAERHIAVRSIRPHRNTNRYLSVRRHMTRVLSSYRLKHKHSGWRNLPVQRPQRKLGRCSPLQVGPKNPALHSSQAVPPKPTSQVQVPLPKWLSSHLPRLLQGEWTPPGQTAQRRGSTGEVTCSDTCSHTLFREVSWYAASTDYWWSVTFFKDQEAVHETRKRNAVKRSKEWCMM